MAEQIITLGIGAAPDNLIPFITTGLEIGAVVVPAKIDITTSLATVTTIVGSDGVITTVTGSEATR